MDLAVNELAFEFACNSQHDAKQRMVRLIATIRALTKLGFTRRLWVPEAFMGIELSEGYLFAQWLNDQTIEREERIFIKTVISSGPYLEQTIQNEIINRGGTFDFEHEGKTAKGLGLGWLRNGPVVSVENAPPFETDPVTIQVASDQENGDDFEVEDCEVCCLTFTEQVTAREDWIGNRLATTYSSGVDLIDRIADDFGCLTFCENAVSQIKSLSGSEQWFGTMVRHFNAINSAIENWKDGPFQMAALTWSGESNATMNAENGRLGKMRNFKCPDGISREMRRHSKIHGANIRIHFLPFVKNQGEKTVKSCFIGYVGPHLETITDY